MSKGNNTPRAIREGESFDLAALNHFLQAHTNLSEVVEVLQFPGGFSNLTYSLNTANGEKYVLRRPPFGANIKSAHDMGREYKVLSALQGVYPKAPKLIILSEDDTVIGAPFYIMEQVDGIILRQQAPKGIDLTPEVMREVSLSSIKHLAELHSLELEANGLGALGKPDGYVQRQVLGWIERYKKSQTDDIPDMEFLAEWMPQHLPREQAPTFIHNDYKYDNLVLNPESLSEITAILDWEMATVGDPLMDLGTTLAYWAEAADNSFIQNFALTHLAGNLTRSEVVEEYTRLTGRDTSDMPFYYAFGCFKIAVICQQIYARYKKGLTQDERFAGLIYIVMASSQAGKKAIETGKI